MSAADIAAGAIPIIAIIGLHMIFMIIVVGMSGTYIVAAIDRNTDALLEQDDEPLAEAVEWETADGLMRTTDKALAMNWTPHHEVRVVRRAGSAS